MMAELINRRALKAETRELLLDAQVSPKAFVALYLVLLLALNLVDSLTGTGILSTFVSILVTLLAVVREAGFIFYCIIKVVKKEARSIHPILWAATALFVLNFIILAIL